MLYAAICSKAVNVPISHIKQDEWNREYNEFSTSKIMTVLSRYWLQTFFLQKSIFTLCSLI